VTMEVLVCEDCGRAVFPARASCPCCGGSAWRKEPAGQGVVEEVTRTAEAVLASVRLDRGPIVVARVTEGSTPGTRLDLSGD
jgi:uncharacterized OB-fold protein